MVKYTVERNSCQEPNDFLDRAVSETGDRFDRSFDLTVELFQVGRWYPAFLVHGRTDRLDRIFAQKLGTDAEPQDIASPAILRIPVASNLCGVGFVRNRIENRLFWKTARERTKARRLDQFVLTPPHRPVQDRQFHKKRIRHSRGRRWIMRTCL